MTDHIDATQEDREAAHRYFAWHNNPSWAQEGGEHFDGNWVPDCQGKQDYDPGFMRFSCRVYPDGQWVASLYMGDDSQLETTEMQRAPDKNAARSAVEAWCADRAKHWADRLASTAALQAERDALAARVEALEGENAALRPKPVPDKSTHYCLHYPDGCTQHNLYCRWPDCAAPRDAARKALGEVG